MLKEFDVLFLLKILMEGQVMNGRHNWKEHLKISKMAKFECLNFQFL